MEFPKEQHAGDNKQTEIQLDNNSKPENTSQTVGKVDTEESNRIGFQGREDCASLANQEISEMKKSIDESQSAPKSSKLDSQESKAESEKGNQKENEPESFETADDMEVEIQSISINSDQSSNLIVSHRDEKIANDCSENPSSSNEDSNVCEEMVAKNSALEVVKVADEEGAASSSTQEVAEAQAAQGGTEEKGTTAAEPTVLCGLYALNALWGYGILISSDDSSDDDGVDEQSTDAVMRDASTQRQSVVSLDSDTSSMSSSTSLFFTDDSGSEDEQASGEKNRPNPRPRKPPMTDGELALEDLPPIEDLKITVPEQECTKVGEVLHIVDKLVIVQGIKNMPPLDLESALFLAWDRPLGLIFDVFGPVVEPSYCVRFNSYEEIKSKNITPGMPVYYGPKSQYTNYVFMQHLLNSKGSDASWTGNNEPPLEQLDFSDDETERAAKKAIKAINKEMKVDADEPQRKKHMAYEQRMNAMNLYMTRVSEMKSQMIVRKRRPPRKGLIQPAVLSAAADTSSWLVKVSSSTNFEAPPPVFQQQPPPYHGGAVALPPSFAPPPFAFNRFVPPPPPAALPKPSMFVDTSRPPPRSPQPPPPVLHNQMAFPPPPSMAVPPPTTPSLFCNVNVPPPPQPAAVATSRLFRSNNSVNLNSLFPDLFMSSSRTAPPPPMLAQPCPVSAAFSFPPPPMGLTSPPPPVALVPPVKADNANGVANANRLPLFNQSTFHNPLHRPATPTPPPYSLFINKA
ncbi:hypothetical protein LSTR_LSTR004705 [Laodelphax striatellus]|uniref:H/ACA ribonucleoprotein complex non-core subunit NAF1 n=1 Tax=Laodelphax striatellus TaxID=195883 RepID=A0A482WTV4_LAOST|nr:hypothetical protein LSTR_LSTR004705 [Laodelphax striatellus]